ncbi:MAG: AAA domain-containing protein [Anaerolineales bacterium]
MTDHTVLLQRLERFVRSEAEAQRNQLRERWARPLSERVARGFAIEGISIASFNSSVSIILNCHTNESRFRDGDFLVLHRGDPEGEDTIEVVLEYDDETQLEVSARTGKLYLLTDQPHGWIADESMLDLSPFFLDALEEVADTQRGRERILPLLTGEKEPTLDYARYERALEAAYLSGLDESQSAAVALAYASDLYHLVQGPPGTGKTFALAHLVRLLVEDGQRVLVTALTHRAINNALNKIHQVDASLPVCKIGLTTRSTDLKVDNFENFAQSGFGDLAGGYAVGATPFATRSERLGHVEFDVVIFDEASQITLALAIMGMLAGVKYIFIGDEQQLPPVVTSGKSEIGSTSIFGYLSSRGNQSMLTTTYRLNDVLAAWPSRNFYQGMIKPAPGVAERRLRLAKLDERWAFALDPRRPAVFLDLEHRNSTIRSRLEAEVVCDLVLQFIEAGIPPAEIGIVVPYRAQGRLIRNLLREALPSRDMLKEIVADTIERMQGQEREVVLVSLATSSSKYATDLAEFFFEPRRLNVAITRPRTKLILIGSRHVLKAEPVDEEQRSWVALLRDLVANCTVFNLPGGRLN